MINWYKFGAVTTMVTVALVYIVRFCSSFFEKTVEDFAIWGQFGDYMGGVLNPILSFISITLLIRSVTLQNQANTDLREEIRENRRTEKIRSFSILFFNMIEEQKALLNGLRFDVLAGDFTEAKGVAAIMLLEDEVHSMREDGKSDDDIAKFLMELDSNEKIFDVLRAFYVTVKIVSEKLSDKNKFNFSDRKEYFETLISFTNFSQLRLIVMLIQFLNYPATSYLRNNREFVQIISDLGLPLDPY